jgi:uncharacterized membrane protein
MKSFWIKALLGLALVAAAITIGIMLAPYILGALAVWLAWKWMVGSASNLPGDSSSQIIDVKPTADRR